MAKNKGGRPKGSRSKSLEMTRDSIARFVNGKFEAKEIEKLYNQILAENGAKDAMNALIALSDFVLPKLQRVEHTGKDGSELSIEHVLNTLDAPKHFHALPDKHDDDIIDITPEHSTDDNNHSD